MRNVSLAKPPNKHWLGDILVKKFYGAYSEKKLTPTLSTGKSPKQCPLGCLLGVNQPKDTVVI